jgi:hypothetical protein
MNSVVKGLARLSFLGAADCRVARHFMRSQIMPHHYGPLNRTERVP